MKEEICVLTGEKVAIKTRSSIESYELQILDIEIEVFVCSGCKGSFHQMPHHIFKSLILNGIWPQQTFLISEECKNSDEPFYSEKIVLNNYLASINYPKTPTERLDSFFMFLFALQKIDGDKMFLDFETPGIWMKNYFVNEVECLFYVEGLIEMGLIEYRAESESPYCGYLRITHKGLNRAIQIENFGSQSNNCFIAMAFDDRTRIFREAIRKAITRSGFQLIIIDEQNIESDKTIPDSILSAIKKSKFCVADFTYHKNGVYFESGYALGLGKPIIYTCQEEEFEKSHFDIKQLQHIIYKDPNDLEKKLFDKIEAWIK